MKPFRLSGRGGYLATRPQNWEAVKALFEAALDEEPVRRLAFLRERCTDPSVCAEVERLLAEYAEAGAFLSRPALDHFPFEADAPCAESEPTARMDSRGTAGTVIGRYHLIQKAGEGGMGEVWEAEQNEPVRLRVTLKLIRTGLNTREAMVRFDSERQALALMDHPAIAKVFDAGATPGSTVLRNGVRGRYSNYGLLRPKQA